ncbi:DUF4326 domain-containing protein [Corallococcus sp. BB11-1]|uniref:DUF4326 domain-containing protein n=1 Tax=Corallococcus sp. BB11-1 TaxID=2996783 RepID=UPI00226F73F0|nr:DUF4326 domain-containing protein [Corallococcus sp. BB11-1]MCY1037163.1 DUF4326 domain-containing protein [Corallococcus sp. BB11-1]
MSESRTTAVHVHDACDVYVGRAFRAWAKPGPLNPVPGRFGNPFKPGGVKTQKAMLRTYFEPWLSALPADEAARIREEALRRMGPEPDAFESFRWYLELRTRHDADFLRDVRALRGKRLGCWCKPGPCHADVLVAWLETSPGAR